MDGLEGAGGRRDGVRADRPRGAAGEAGPDLPESQRLILGDPRIGTPAMQRDILAGLYLPLKILLHDDGGQTRVAYEEVEETFDALDPEGELMGRMVEELSQAAAGG